MLKLPPHFHPFIPIIMVFAFVPTETKKETVLSAFEIYAKTGINILKPRRLRRLLPSPHQTNPERMFRITKESQEFSKHREWVVGRLIHFIPLWTKNTSCLRVHVCLSSWQMPLSRCTGRIRTHLGTNPHQIGKILKILSSMSFFLHRYSNISASTWK